MTILAKDCRVKLNRESVYLHGRHVTEFLTNSCVFAYTAKKGMVVLTTEWLPWLQETVVYFGIRG